MLEFNNFLESLPYMAKGMLGIFVAISVILLVTVGLTKLFPAGEEDK